MLGRYLLGSISVFRSNAAKEPESHVRGCQCRAAGAGNVVQQSCNCGTWRPCSFSLPLSHQKPIGTSQVRPQRLTICRASNSALLHQDGTPHSPRSRLRKQCDEGQYKDDEFISEEEDDSVPRDIGVAFGGEMDVYIGGAGVFDEGTTPFSCGGFGG